MISVIIPTLNAEAGLLGALSSLLPAALEGLVREVIVVDGGSSDRTGEIADEAGAVFIAAPRGRGAQLAFGAREAKGPWLLFLHADTVLEMDWQDEVRGFLQDEEKGPERAAAFRFALRDNGFWPRYLEAMVFLRCLIFRLPYGDQGLLIRKEVYDRLGGYRPIPLMEDVDLVRRIGRKRLTMLRARALTDAGRFKRAGYPRRMLRNLSCLAQYYRGVTPEKIAARYEKN